METLMQEINNILADKNERIMLLEYEVKVLREENKKLKKENEVKEK